MRHSFKKLVLAVVAILAMVLGALGVVPLAQAWPTSGWHDLSDYHTNVFPGSTVQWQIIGTTLYIQPSKGSEGVLYSDGGGRSDSYPWGGKNIKAVQCTGQIDVSGKTGNMFADQPELEDISGLSHFDVSNVTDMNYMFDDDTKLSDLNPLSKWKTDKVTDMSRIFASDSILSDLTALSNWNVSHVSNMSGMFENDKKLSDLTPLSNWKTGAGRDMHNMFASDSALATLKGLENWDVSHVTLMNSMFDGDTKLNDLTPLSKWKTGAVQDMSYMFQGDSALATLKGLENWDVSKVTSMVQMFDGDTKLNDLMPLNAWNVSMVNTMFCMFDGDSALATLKGLENWNVNNVVTMNGMFDGDSALKDLSAISFWSVNFLRDTTSMFSGISPHWTLLGVPAAARRGATIAQAYYNDLPADHHTKIISTDGAIPSSRNYTIGEWSNPFQSPTFATDFSQGRVFKRQPQWTLSFNKNGGNGSMSSLTVDVGDQVTLPANTSFYRFGWIWDGWVTEPDAESPLYKAQDKWPPSSISPKNGDNITLYAHWKKIVTPPTPLNPGPGGNLPGWTQVGNNNGTTGEITPSGVTASFTNQYNANSTSFGFQLSKLVDGRAPKSSEQYSFQLKDESGKVLQRVKNIGEHIVFPPLVYKQPGSYAYTVTEDPTTVPANVSPDTHKVFLEVDVHPTDDTHAGLWTTSQFAGDLTFDNKYKPGSLAILKGVCNTTGTQPATNVFPLRVHAMLNGKPLSGTYGGTTFTNGEANVSATGGLENCKTGTVSGGKPAVITSLPVGTVWRVSEPNPPAGFVQSDISPSDGTIPAGGRSTSLVTNTYGIKPTSAAIHLTKKLYVGPGNAPMTVPDGQYRFTICQKTGTVCEPRGSVYANNNGSIDFPESYKKPGTYHYVVSELNDHKTGVHYDKENIAVTVLVSADGYGKLTAHVDYPSQRVFVNHIPQIGSIPVAGGGGILPFIVNIFVVALASLLVILLQEWIAAKQRRMME